MDPDMINCTILLIHVENKIIILSHAILWQTSVSARYGRKKQQHSAVLSYLVRLSPSEKEIFNFILVDQSVVPIKNS